MSTLPDSSLFVDVADALGLGNPAIVEKDYYAVQLLKLIAPLNLPHHQIVFSGGTALAKSRVKTYRMSEDIDLKLIPSATFSNLNSRSTKKSVRRTIKNEIEGIITNSNVFSIESDVRISDEYRYFCFDVRYPQQHQQAPCLRPFIKLEFIESELLTEADERKIQSIYSEILSEKAEVSSFPCASILETQAEKMISMLRRTASSNRSIERADDQTLIRHVYDTYCIQQHQASDLPALANLVKKVVHMDTARYGSQHPQMLTSPFDELRYGLNLLETNVIHRQRYEEYVEPIVYSKTPISWDDAFPSFKNLVLAVLEEIDSEIL